MNPIIEHALTKIWTNPKQDYQAIVRPAQVTPSYGAVNRFHYSYREYGLPEDGAKFHVYTYGGYWIENLNVKINYDQWYHLPKLMKEQGFTLDLYTVEGYMLPKYDCWISQLRNGLFLIAVKDRNHNRFTLGTKEIYARTYMNAWYSISSDSVKLEVLHFDLENNSKIMACISAIKELQAKEGHTWLIVNGYFFDAEIWNGYASTLGDWVEVYRDSSIKRVVNYPLNNPLFYTSLLDKKQKYLLHYSTKVNTIEHYDDVDFWVQYDGKEGLYYHRNDPQSVRMLTHQDYGILVDNVVRHQQSQSNWSDATRLSIKAFIRYSGTNRQLVHEHSRIHELYKLPDEKILRSMHGILANLPEWHVTNLEKSAYPAIMNEKSTCLKLSMVEEGLGYNAISMLLANTPSRISSGSGSLPWLAQLESTVFEYDNDGNYTGNKLSTDLSVYLPSDPKTASIEAIVGHSGPALDEVYGEKEVVIPVGANFRCYFASLIAGEIQENTWVDVTDSNNYTIVEKDNVRKIVWSDVGSKLTLVRFDTKNLLYKTTVSYADGVFDLDVMSSYKLPWDNYSFAKTQLVPCGQYDFWLDNKILAEGIDYVFNFPKMVLISKDYLKEGTDLQEITVRGIGFCDSKLKPTVKRESGFVLDGMISTNDRFFIRDDIVMRFSVDGKLKHRDELAFAETDNGVFKMDTLNGKPYMATEILVPLRDAITSDSMKLRERSRDLDARIEAYLSDELPDRSTTNTHVISRHYPLYSPVVFSVIMAILSGEIPSDEVRRPLVDMRILKVTDPYVKKWFDYDPVNPKLLLDDKVVMIHPHPFNHTVWLDLFQYRFVDRFVKLFSQGRVQLSHFIQFKEPNA